MEKNIENENITFGVIGLGKINEPNRQFAREIGEEIVKRGFGIGCFREDLLSAVANKAAGVYREACWDMKKPRTEPAAGWTSYERSIDDMLLSCNAMVCITASPEKNIEQFLVGAIETILTNYNWRMKPIILATTESYDINSFISLNEDCKKLIFSAKTASEALDIAVRESKQCQSAYLVDQAKGAREYNGTVSGIKENYVDEKGGLCFLGSVVYPRNM